MLTITIPEQEGYDEKLGKFIKINSHTLKLEHSLLSLYKWESKHHKYFLGNQKLTQEEILDYIKCMTINQVDDYVYSFLTEENLKDIQNYLKDPMTATWFSDDKNGNPPKKEIITAEVIYSSMIILQIPIEIFEKRHINHLLTLIRVCNEKQNPDQKKKIKTNDLAAYYSQLNKQRKAKLGTKG